MQIREPQPGDVGWIIGSHAEVYADEFGFDASWEYTIAGKLARYFNGNEPFNRVWIAEADGQRAGSIAVRAIGDEVAFIHFVLVLDRFRGRGIAGALMGALSDYASRHHRHLLRLETFSCLRQAREMYRKLGFAPVESGPLRAFGQDLTQEFWERELSR